MPHFDTDEEHYEEDEDDEGDEDEDDDDSEEEDRDQEMLYAGAGKEPLHSSSRQASQRKSQTNKRPTLYELVKTEVTHLLREFLIFYC